MSQAVPCVRYDTPGADDPELRAVLADATRRAGWPIDPLLRGLYYHDKQLLVTWRDASARDLGANALGAVWRARSAGSQILHLLPLDEDYDYQEDVADDPT